MGFKNALMVSAGILAVAGAARAQTPETPTVEEIIVTAEKRSVSLQDVPVAVSAYTAETRQMIGLDSLQEFTNFTPGLSFSAADDRVFVRGVGRQTNTNGSDPGVATYSDGVYNAATSSAGVSDFFVDRVEILRGPQGTLYGRNSIGGAINAISKRPTRSLSGEVRATVGDYGVANLEASASGPLTEGLRFRLAGARYNQEDGYFTNAAGGPSEGGAGERRNVELQVEVDLGENLNVWAKVFASDADLRPRSRNVAGAYDYATYPTNFIAPGSAVGYTTVGYTALGSETTNPGARDIRRFSTDSVQRNRLHDSGGLAVEAIWSLPGVDVKYIGGYQEYVYDLSYDYDNTSVLSYDFPLDAGFSVCNFIPGCAPLQVFPSQLFNFRENKSFGSSELNLSSNGEGPVQWIVGVYRYTEALDQQIHFNAPNQPQLRAPANGPANPLGDFVFAGSTLESRSSAVFGQIDWSLTDALSLTAGLRYTHDEKDGFERLRILCFSCGGYEPGQYGSYAPALDITAAFVSYAAAPGVASPVAIDPVTGMARRDLSGSWNATTGTLGVQWKPDDDTLAFARYSRGYKAGGFNAGGISVLPQTDPEKIDALEFGYKRTFGSLQVNTALFHYRYEGLQIPLTVTIPGGASLTEFFNLDKSTSWGAEIEAVWRATDALQLMLSYGYGHSEIEDACCFVDGADPRAVQPGALPVGAPVAGQQPQSLQGQELPQTPQQKIALNANYRFDFDAGSLVLSGSYVWKAETYQSVFNRSYNLSPSYDQVDLRAVWTASSDRYRIIGFVKNVFDQVGYDNASGSLLASPPAAPEAISTTYGLTPPRTVGVQFQYRFD